MRGIIRRGRRGGGGGGRTRGEGRRRTEGTAAYNTQL